MSPPATPMPAPSTTSAPGHTPGSLEIQVESLRLDATPQAAARELIGALELSIPPGRIHTLMGPSGCGKSSLLAAVCGTLAPPLRFTGSIRLDGAAIDSLPTNRRQVGILFQDDLLYPHMTVRENLLFALPPGARAAREEAVRQALADLELAGHADADPATLSGGERQRVALMRALLARPRALLLDEPFSRLDLALRQRMRGFVFDAVRQRGIPVLLVTHDAADVADVGAVTRLS